MHQVEIAPRLQKLEIIYPAYFCPIGIDNLFIQQRILQQEFALAQDRLTEILQIPGVGYK